MDLTLNIDDYANLRKLLNRVRDINGVDESRVVSMLAIKLDNVIASLAPANNPVPNEEENGDVPTDTE